MAKYEIWYMKPAWFRVYAAGHCGRKPDPTNLDATHVHLKQLKLPDDDLGLEHVFSAMQGENWSPNGEARPLIEAKGLQHTSMSVGDVIVDEKGIKHVVACFGFEQL
jgi:hypothetical protein